MTFPQWLKAARGDRSQQQVADLATATDAACRIYQSRLSEWELGDALPSLRQLVAICDGLGLDVAQRAAGRALWDAAQLPARPAA